MCIFSTFPLLWGQYGVIFDFWIPKREHSSAMTVLLKLGSPITMQFCGCSKYTDVILIELLGYSASLLIFCDESHRMSGEMVSNYQHRGTTVGVVCKLSSPLTLMEVKSMCTKSKGAVAIIGCNGSFVELNSCLMHFWQFLTAFLTSEGILGH